MRLDFARARRNSSFALLSLDEFQNVSLPIGQHAITLPENPGPRKFK
jgi:hypothetical protein